MNPTAPFIFSTRCRREILAVVLALGFGLALRDALAARSDSDTPVPIQRNILTDKAEYHGPEREDPEPKDLREIRIGFFAPRGKQNAIGRNLWRGATLATEKANADGGYRGKPFRLVCRWADNPWGAGSREMTRLVYEDKVWAVIGSIDGAATHVAEQVATKARITLLSPLSGDPSLTRTAVPWMFRLAPDDASVIEALTRHAVEKLGLRRIILLTSGDHEGRIGALETLPALGRRRSPPVLHLNFDASQTDFSQQLDRILSTPAEAIFLWGLPEPCCRLLVALRGRGVTLPLFGPPTFSLASFIQKADGAAEGLTTCRLTWGDDEARWQGFEKAFEKRFEEKPDADAALAYDAATIIIEAIRKGGLNRARIRDGVAEMSGFSGVCGKVTWDNGGGNIAAAELIMICNGEPSSALE